MSQSKQLALSLADVMEELSVDQGNSPLSHAWANLLHVPEHSPELFLAVTVMFGRFKDLRRIVDASIQSVRAKELYVGAIDQLAEFAAPSSITQRTTNQVAAAKDKISLLHLLADAFPAEMIPDVQQATLEELCKELEGIVASLPDTDIEPQVRSLISTSLETLLMVLRSYKLFGPDGAARIYGSVAAELSRSLRQEPPATEQGKSAVQRVIALTKKIGAVIIWTSAVTGGVDTLLTSGADIASMITGPDHAAASTKDSPGKAG